MSEMSQAPLAQGADAASISRRAYNALTFGLVTASFLVMWGMYLFASGPTFYHMMTRIGTGSALAVFIVSLVASIAGIVLMNVGKSKQSMGLSLGGYVLFSLTFGFTTAIGLTTYSVGTIAYAFGITACLSGIFLLLGVMFPEFFASIGHILFAGLLGVIVLEIVATLVFHADQTIFDYLVIVLFCGFLGYDSFLMAADSPTVPNAIWHASDIYLDIVNILIRVLSILDRD